MEVRPQTISQFSYPRRFIRGLASRSLAPLILLECFVTGGRTVQAYKRGGFEEARERFTEETIGAAFWFAGVKMFNKMNDHIGKKILHLHTADFDAQEDGVRKPLKNFLHDDKSIKTKAKLAGKTGKLIQNLTKNQIAVFKALKIGSSIILANLLVGFVVPKINQHITAVYHEKHFGQDKENKDKPTNTAQTNYQQISMDKFMKSEDNKNIPFGMNYNALLSIANKFENDATYQLLSTDVGIAGGRAISSRNEHERVEVLFRDLTSIYFYMFSMPNINRWLNQIEDGRKTRLDPVAALGLGIRGTPCIRAEAAGDRFLVRRGRQQGSVRCRCGLCLVLATIRIAAGDRTSALDSFKENPIPRSWGDFACTDDRNRLLPRETYRKGPFCRHRAGSPAGHADKIEPAGWQRGMAELRLQTDLLARLWRGQPPVAIGRRRLF